MYKHTHTSNWRQRYLFTTGTFDSSTALSGVNLKLIQPGCSTGNEFRGCETGAGGADTPEGGAGRGEFKLVPIADIIR